MTTWYLGRVYRFFRWYKNVFAGVASPHAWASAIFVGCHYANVGTVLLLYSKLAGKTTEWTVGASTKLVLVGSTVSLVYCVVVAGVLERMEAVESAKNDDELQDALGRPGVPLYVVVSIAALIGTIIFLAAS